MLHSKRAQYASYPLKFLVVLFLMVAAMALPATAKASALASGPYDHGRRCDAYYTVHRGDTLSLIAARYGINVRHLADINGIYNVNRIYSGQQLCILYDHGGYGDHDGYGDHNDYGNHDDYGDHGWSDYNVDHDDGGYKDGCCDMHSDRACRPDGCHDCGGCQPQEHRCDRCDDHGGYPANKCFAQGGFPHTYRQGDTDNYGYRDAGYYGSDGGYSQVKYYPDPRMGYGYGDDHGYPCGPDCGRSDCH